MSKKDVIFDSRVQNSLLAAVEKKALIWMAERTPRWISPDMLTFFGLLGNIISGYGYYMGNQSPLYLVLCSFGIFINWIGDSMDGTLARVREQTRPKYGFYLDHLVDAIGVSLLFFGLAYSGMATPIFIWIIMVLFLIASINTYIALSVMKVFKISFGKLSTTEGRVLMIIFNTILIFIKDLEVGDFHFFLLDLIAVIAGIILLVIIISSAYKNLRILDREERNNWK